MELQNHPDCECHCHCGPCTPCQPVVDGLAWCCSEEGLAYNEKVREEWEVDKKRLAEAKGQKP